LDAPTPVLTMIEKTPNFVWVVWKQYQTNIPWALGASPAVLGLWHCIVKLDDKKSKHAGLVQENDFWLRLRCLIKCAATPCTSVKECNRYDLTVTECFWLAHHNDSSRWLPIGSTPSFAVPISVLWVGLQISKITKLGCENYVCRVTCLTFLVGVDY
jgi:hypothetical protein